MPATFRSVSALEQGSGPTVTVDKPSGLADGDMLVAVCASTPASGWTGEDGTRTQSQITNGTVRLEFLWRNAGASEPSTFDFTTGGSVTGAAVCLLALQNSGVTGGLNPYGSASASSTYALPELTTIDDSEIMIQAFASDYIGDITVPSASTLVNYQFTYLNLCVSYEVAVSAGAQPAVTFASTDTDTSRSVFAWSFRGAGWEAVARPSAFMLFVD